MEQHGTSRGWVFRLFLLGVMLVGLVLVGRFLRLEHYLESQNLQALVERAGVWGFFVYTVGFVLGSLIHIPGMVFVAAGVHLYGKFTGGLLAVVAAVIAVSVSFWVVRGVGGKALTEMKWGLLQRILSKLDEKPVTTVILLRLVFWLAPPVNYALALSSLRFRYYLVGSSIGLLFPILGASFLFDYIFLFLGWKR